MLLHPYQVMVEEGWGILSVQKVVSRSHSFFEVGFGGQFFEYCQFFLVSCEFTSTLASIDNKGVTKSSQNIRFMITDSIISSCF
jgi:hypothetical protein